MTGERRALPDRGEIMMPVPEEAALRQMEIEVMRSIQRSFDTTARQLESMNGKIDRQGDALTDVRERLIRIEEGRYGAKVEELQADVDLLKTEKAMRDGAIGLVNWFGRNWLILVLIIFVAALLLRVGGKLPL